MLVVAPAAHRAALETVLGAGVLWTNPVDSVEATRQTLASRGDVEAVCLVGDAAALPFAWHADPCGYDEVVFTDAPYGHRGAPAGDGPRALLPDVPVSRIPSTDPTLVGAILRRVRITTSTSTWVSVTASPWATTTSAMLARLDRHGAPVSVPPQVRADVAAALATAPDRALFNVHGTNRDDVWFGEGDREYPEALRPEDVVIGEGALVVSEACYGATLGAGPKPIGRAFLAAGAAGFIGSTIIAWGAGAGGAPALADVLAMHVLRFVDNGVPLAEALLRAKVALLAEAQSADMVSPALSNTLASFVAYGWPLAAVVEGVPVGSAVTSASGVGGPKTAARSTLEAARAALQARLEPAAWRTVTAGRVTMAELDREFGGRTAIQARLAALLGLGDSSVQDAHRVRLASGAAWVTAHTPGPVPRRAAVLVDATGRVSDEVVSR